MKLHDKFNMVKKNTTMENRSFLPGVTLNYLLIIILLLVILYFGAALFIPMFYGLFIAIVLYPACRWLEHHHFPRSLAIAAGLTVVILLVILLFWLLALQFSAFSRDIPELRTKIEPTISSLHQWIAENLNIPIASQQEWLKNSVEKGTGNTAGILAGIFSKTLSGLYMLILTPVFAALFLYNRNDFVLALEKMAGKGYEDKLHQVLHQTMYTYYHFIKGMIFVYLIVGALNSIGLLALGIEHAILFGFLTAIMTIIPYLGIFISALLPVTVAWITKDSIWYPIAVIAVFAFVQYLEANVIFPRVVATQLNLSTWATLVAIIAGGILWGVNGMILFIPFTGMLKILTGNIPELEGLNLLLSRKIKSKTTK